MNKDISNNRPACYVPWVTSYEYSNGYITPCCEWLGGATIKTNEHMSLEDRFNHPKTKELRTQLLTCDKNDIDSLPAGCLQCKVFEKSGNDWHSMRQWVSKIVEDTGCNKPCSAACHKLPASTVSSMSAGVFLPSACKRAISGPVLSVTSSILTPVCSV